MPPDLDLRLLRYFVATAEELHFGRAAARLHVSQPNLSVQVRRLEQQVGVRLLERTSRRVSLTQAGEVFLEESRRLLASVARACAAARSAAEGARGRLVVGFVANAAGELTPRIVNAFQAAHPGVGLQLQQHDFADPYAGLADGSADVAFVRPPLVAHPWLAIETLFVEPRVLVVSQDYAVAAQERVTVEQLLDDPFVARRAPAYWRDFWLAADQRDGHPVRIGAEASTVDECFAAILAGRGMAFTQLSSQRFYARPGISFVPVDGLPPTAVSIAWRRDAETPLVREFVELARTLAVVEGVPDSVLPGRLAAG